MSYGQDVSDVTRFLGIPIDGTKEVMISKLKDKGFSSVPDMDGMLEGEFNGKNVYVSVQTNNRKVWRIGVLDKSSCDETQIKINFNNLCSQFENNSKYVSFGDQTIAEGEDIGYEMAAHNKRYEAHFYQKSLVGEGSTDDSMNRLVWFMIDKDTIDYGKYLILMFYENGYNKANGEDL